MTDLEPAPRSPSSSPGPDADLYAVLGVSRDASKDDVNKAYRRESKRWHPDRNPGDDHAKVMYERVDVAHKVLGDDAARRRYDETGKWRDDDPGRREAYVRRLLIDAFVQVIQQVAEAGEDVRKEPVTGHVLKAMDCRKKELRVNLQKARKAAKGFADAVGRFSIEGEENLLERIMVDQAKAFDAKVSSIEVELDLVDDAIALAKRYRYKMDAKNPTGIVTSGAWTINWEVS